MAKMRAVDAAVLVLEKEGIDTAFGVPGAAINPFYSAMRKAGNISHVLARHVEGASHMAEGYTRAQPGNIGVCIGTSGPAGTDMITGLYSAQADSIPILAITGQAPRARLYKEDFQAVDIESIAKPVTKWAVTVREPALVPRVFQQAFHLMRSGRPGPVLVDLPIDVQLAEIEFDIDTYEPLPVYKPKATRKQIEAALTLAERFGQPLIVSGGGVLNAAAEDLLVRVRRNDRRAGDADADVVGRDSRRSSVDGRHGRSADVAPLRQRDDARLRFRARHRQPLGEPSHRQRRGLYEGPQVRARGYRADADWPRVRAGPRHRVGCEGRARTVRRSRRKNGRPPAS
jgi:thiamine pyrophosphate-dependent acetolactate synthase large subunit-like protein